MEYRKLRGTEEKISLLGMGCMRFPTVGETGEIDEAEAQKIVDYAYEHGVNYFDTAFMYHGGKSEGFIGRALKKYPRESYNLITKMPGWEIKEPSDVERIFNLQLSRCGVDYFDFYLCHSVRENNFAFYEDNHVFEFLTEMKKQGKVRHIGFSFHDTPEVLEKVIDKYPWEFVQIQLNYLDWELQDAKRQYEIIKSRGIQCIIMEPVRGGALADLCPEANELLLQAQPDKSIASWAIRYAASLDNVLTVLSGMTSMEQVQDNVATLSAFAPLSDAERSVLDKALDIYKKKDTVPCTGCRYCMDCPFGVDIPGVFAAFNEYIIGGRKAQPFLDAYGALEREKASAEYCKSCGKCMKLCPQAIEIPEKMGLIAGQVSELKK